MKSWPVLLSVTLQAVSAYGMGGGAYPSRVLDNGMEVIVVENHTVPLATIGIILRGGAFTESWEENGLTNLYHSLFFKANRVLSSAETYLERVRELGIVTGGNSREEWIHFHIILSKDSLDSGLEFMQQAIQFPLFDIDELEREKRVIVEEIDQLYANPNPHLVRAINRKLWGTRASRKDYLGNSKMIRAATLEQIRQIHGRYALPNNAALLVAGDVNPKEVFRLAEEQFGEWQAGADPEQASPIPPMIPLHADEDTVVIQPVTTARIALAWQGPSVMADVKGTFAADVLSLILTQKTSAFQKNLVDAGDALSAEMFYLTQKHVGPIFVFVRCPPQKTAATRAAVQAEVEKLADPGYFTDEQLKTAKTLLEVDAVYKHDKASTFINEIGFWWAVAGLDYYRDYLDNLRAVSRKDIVNYVNRYIIGQPHVTATMLSREAQQQFNIVEGSLSR